MTARGAMGAGVLAGLALAACGTSAVDPRCAFVKEDGMCEVEVSLDPREADAPDEATTMEVRWTWIGAAEVLPRSVRYHLTAEEAAWRRASWESLGKSRCVVEVPVAGCEAPRRIVFVEAEP